MQKIYCFNPSCLQVNQNDRSCICCNCGSPLTLKDRYQAIEILHKNNCDRAFRVCDLINHNNYTLKQIQKENIDLFDRTVTHLQKIDCYPDIPKYIDSFEIGNYNYLIQESIEGDNLEVLIARGELLDVDRVWQILLDILPVLDYLQGFRLIQGSIDPQNIVYATESGKFILVDWSNLAEIEKANSLSTISAEYSAPETFQGKTCFASDIYSLGLVCLSALTRLRPFDLFDTITNNWVWRDYWQVREGKIISYRRDKLIEILDRSIVTDSSKRWQSAAELLCVMGHNPREQKEKTEFDRKNRDTSKYIWHLRKVVNIDRGVLTGFNCLDWSFDRKILASGGDNKKIALWHPETGAKIIDLSEYRSKIVGIKFLPKSNILVGADSKGKIIFWRWNLDRDIDNNMLSSLDTGNGIISIAIHPELPLLASGHIDKKIRIWHSQTKELIATLSGHALAITDLHFSSTLPLLASASQDRMVKIWQIDRWELDRTLKGHNWAVKTISFNANTNLLASAGDGKDIKIWDLQKSQLLRSLSGHSWTVSSVSFLPDSNNLLLSASWDKKIKLWDVETGEELVALEGHQDSILSLVIRKNPSDFKISIATTSQDKTIGIWDLEILDI
jgi:WD40 repeat protein